MKSLKSLKSLKSSNPNTSKPDSSLLSSNPKAMDASSSSSSSSCSKKPCLAPPTLTSLPEELIARIIVAVATTGWTPDYIRVASLSKQLRRISEDPSVLRSAGYEILYHSIWTSIPYRERLFQACLASGNPHALAVQGKANYFLFQRRFMGLGLLRSIADHGHPRATYVCGISLLCLGGWDKHTGLDMLSRLMHPFSVHNSMFIVGNLRRTSSLEWWPVGCVADTFREMKQSYVRGPCDCNGKTTTFVELSALQRCRKVIHGEDLPASEACLICFWDHQVQRLLHGYD